MSINVGIQNVTAAKATHHSTFSTLDFENGSLMNRVSVFIDGENHETVAACMAQYFNDHLQSNRPPPQPQTEGPDFDDLF